MSIRQPWARLGVAILLLAGSTELLAQRPRAGMGMDREAMRECMQQAMEERGGAVGAEERPARLEALFDTADSDDDGFLDGEEFAELLAMQQRERLFGRLDADEDGLLSREELAAAGERRQGRPTAAMRECMQQRQ